MNRKGCGCCVFWGLLDPLPHTHSLVVAPLPFLPSFLSPTLLIASILIWGGWVRLANECETQAAVYYQSLTAGIDTSDKLALQIIDAALTRNSKYGSELTGPLF